MATAHITYRVHDRALFEACRETFEECDAELLVTAMLTGKPPVECGYEIIEAANR
jgi:hypothetical protein